MYHIVQIYSLQTRNIVPNTAIYSSTRHSSLLLNFSFSVYISGMCGGGAAVVYSSRMLMCHCYLSLNA